MVGVEGWFFFVRGDNDILPPAFPGFAFGSGPAGCCCPVVVVGVVVAVVVLEVVVAVVGVVVAVVVLDVRSSKGRRYRKWRRN